MVDENRLLLYLIYRRMHYEKHVLAFKLCSMAECSSSYDSCSHAGSGAQAVPVVL